MHTDESILELLKDLVAYKKSVVGSEVHYPPPSLQVDAAEVIKQLMQERDEADRKAGSAMRRLASTADTLEAFSRTRDKQKEELGYDKNVSFDVVWRDLMEERNKYLQK